MRERERERGGESEERKRGGRELAERGRRKYDYDDNANGTDHTIQRSEERWWGGGGGGGGGGEGGGAETTTGHTL